MDEEKDEFTFDFSKPKKKKEEIKEDKGTEKEHKKESKGKKDEEFTLDFKSILKFFDKYKNIFIPLFLILICLYVGIHYRLYPNSLPVTDDWARNTVYNYYRNSSARRSRSGEYQRGF